MGCTSSATNTLPPTPQANATDTEEKIHVEQSKQLQPVATIELPECDTVIMNQVEVAMVASNNESSIKENLLLDPKDHHIEELAATELDNQDVAKQTEIHDDAKENTTVKSDEKITNMEDIVDKVLELHIADSCPANGVHTEEIIETSAIIINGQNKVDTTDEITNEETEQEHEEEELSSVVSPSQSQSSRATRWEALADIVAELPPSLTVDPLTGQIYALSK